MTSTKQHKKLSLSVMVLWVHLTLLHLLTKELHKSLELSKFPNCLKKAVGDALDLSHALAFTSPQENLRSSSTLTVRTLILLLSLPVLHKNQVKLVLTL